MLAFLKRRWILLTCGVVFAACSVINFERETILVYSVSGTIRVYSIANGSFQFLRRIDYMPIDFDEMPPHLKARAHQSWNLAKTNFAFQTPAFYTTAVGIWPDVTIRGNHLTYIYVPVWIPLSAVIAWIVLREMQRKEKKQ